MTIEELLEKLGVTESDDAKEAINDFVAAETAGLKRNRDDLKREKRDLEGKLTKLKGLDVDAVAEALGREADDFDLDELPNLIKAAGPKGEPDDKNDPRVEELERKLDRAEKRFNDAISAKDQQIEALTGSISDRAVSAAAMEAIGAKKGNAKLLLPHVKTRIKAEVGEDGEVELVVLGANGEPMEDDKGNPAGVKDLIEEFYRSDDYAAAFEPSSPSGPGFRRPGSQQNRNNPWAQDTLNVTEQSRIQKENPALAKQLKEQAGRTAA